MDSSLTSTLLRDLDNLVREIHTIYESSFKNFSLQKGQFAYLTRICEHEGINLADLSFQLRVDKTTTTKAVQKLILSNLIIKEQDTLDKRIWHLFPTDKTRELYSQIILEKNRVLELCFAGFNSKEQISFGNLVTKMAANIAKEWEKITHRER
jgi:DNA-binding MarR family transcriptional regulator